MRAFLSLFPLLLTLTPTLALAQASLDSVHVVVADGVYPSYVYSQATVPDTLGPLPFVLVEGDGTTAPPAHGCDPLVNAAAVAGNVALIERGTCSFDLKLQQAAAAGAMVAVLANNDASDPDYIGPPVLCSICPPYETPLPFLFVSYNSGQAILTELASGPTDVTLVPIRIYIPPPPPTSAALSTGVVETEVYDYGFIGRDVSFDGPGFAFGGVDGLFVSTVLVGIDGNVVTNPYEGLSEWTVRSEVVALDAPFPAPFESFSQGFETAFASDELGVRVTERSYARMGDSFVIVELEIENISGSDLDGVYVGILADWDAGLISVDDRAGVRTDVNLVYVYDGSEDAPYFGVAALGVDGLSGYSADITAADDAQLFEALSTAIEPGGGETERSAVTGVGPYDLAAEETVDVRFAFVGGAGEAELFEHAAEAQSVVAVAVEEATQARGFAMHPVYPNPLASHATISLDLPTAQAIRVAVFDVLGREVAVLHDGPLAAGTHRLRLDAVALTAGLYFVRATGEGYRATRKLVVTRGL